MARTKKTNDDDSELFQTIAKQSGGVVLSDIVTSKYFVGLSSLALNWMSSGQFINGGIPGSRVTELLGSESTGKSYIAANCLYNTQKMGGIPVYLDCENAINPEFMESSSHVDISKILKYSPDSLEAAFAKIYAVIELVRKHKSMDIPLVIVYDSISVSPSARELREVKLPEKYTLKQYKEIVGSKEQPGERAKICCRELRKLEQILEKNNATLIVVNQLRSRINVLWGDPMTTAGGGESLKYYCSLRFKLLASKRIEDKTTKECIGVNLRIKNVKNRSFKPFRETEDIQLFFEKGINPLSGLTSCLVQSKRIRPGAKKGQYIVNDEWAGDKIGYEFTSKTNNILPEVVLDCPALIDAKSKEEVENYLRPFQEAIDLSWSSSVKEKSIQGDEMESDDDAGDDEQQESSEE